MKIIYTRKAKADLHGIREYYAPLSTHALERITGDVIGLVEDIPTSVAKGRVTPHGEVWEKLTLKYGYLVPYHIFQGNLYVLRVYDQRRGELDYEEILNLEE